MAKDNDKKKEEPKAEASPEELAAKAAKRKKLIFIGGGVLTAALIGGGAFFFLAGGDNKMAAKPGADHEVVAEEAAAPAAEEAGHAAEPTDAHAEAGAPPTTATATTPEGQAAAPAPATPGIDFGCTHALKPFHLNLGNPLENRYIRMEISVEYGCAENIAAEMEKRLPQLRDAVISVVGQKTREALLSPDGKAQLTKEIHHRLNHYMTNKIDNVFITDILIE